MNLTDDDKRWITDLLNERLEAMETKLLTAFHGWGSPVEARQRSHTSTLRALDLEFEELRERIEKLEKRGAA